MSGTTPAKPASSSEGVKLSPKAIVAIVILVVSLIFVFSNREDATLRWLFLDFTAPGWIMLLLLLGAGMAIGFFLGRNRYRKK